MSATPEMAVDGWVGRIQPHLDRAAQEWIAAGDELLNAKEALPHGAFGLLLTELDMAASTATRLMRIARNPVLRDRAPGHALPSSWRTLGELARLPDDVLEAAIDSGAVNTATTRAEAEALRQTALRSAEAVIDSMRAFARDAGGLVVLAMLIRGMDEVDAGDQEIREALHAIVVGALDGMPARSQDADPLGELSAAIGSALRLLWQDDVPAAVQALAVVSMKASTVPLRVRPDLLLQVLDGCPVEEVHPGTRLVVNALLAGFAIEMEGGG